MLGQQAGVGVLLVGGQGTGIHVGLVVQLLQYFFYSFSAGFRYAAASVQHPVYGAHRDIGHLCDIFDSDSAHLLVLLMVYRHYLCAYTIIILIFSSQIYDNFLYSKNCCIFVPAHGSMHEF